MYMGGCPTTWASPLAMGGGQLPGGGLNVAGWLKFQTGQPPGSIATPKTLHEVALGGLAPFPPDPPQIHPRSLMEAK